MIINLLESINSILKDDLNKIKSIGIIQKEIQEGLNSISKCNQEIIFRLSEHTYIRVYPLNQFENIFNDTNIRATKDFNKIHKFNSFKHERDELLKELKSGLTGENLELLNRFVKLGENKLLFAVEMVEGNNSKPKILCKNTGIYFNNISELIISYLGSFGVVIETLNNNQ